MALPVGSAKGAHYAWYKTFFHFLTPENPGAHYTWTNTVIESSWKKSDSTDFDLLNYPPRRF